MKTVLIGIFTGALLLAVAVAQDTAKPSPDSQPSNPPTSAPVPQQSSPTTQAPVQQQSSQMPAAGQQHITRIAAGSVLPVSLTKTVDAKKAKPGDEVVAKVTQDMKSNSGDVILAKDTKVMGHVTEAQARNKEQKESQLAIAFDHAVTKNGTEMNMPMSIQAIVGFQNNGPNGQNAPTNGSSPAAEPSSSGSNANSAGRPGMNGSSSYPSASSNNAPSANDTQTTSSAARPPINSQTQGVIGISDLTLAATASNSTQGSFQGSLMTSEKNNVKIESGTLMLLRVNQ
jgi:hypothetical protein